MAIFVFKRCLVQILYGALSCRFFSWHCHQIKPCQLSLTYFPVHYWLSYCSIVHDLYFSLRHQAAWCRSCMKQSARFVTDLTLDAVYHSLALAYTQFIYHFFSLCQPALHLKSLSAEYFHLVCILIEDYSHTFYCLLCLVSNRHKDLNEGSRQVTILVYNFFPDTSVNPFTVILVLWTTTCLAWNVQTYLCKPVNKKGCQNYSYVVFRICCLVK